MPLTKSKGNMYPWVTHTHTHLAGVCPHKCSYCYVQAIARRFGHERYTGELRLVERELSIKYGNGRTIFVEHCNDLWADGVPDEWIEAILAHCREWPNEYVFQSKNPDRMREWLGKMPPDRLLGCTIESTDPDVIAEVSDAPNPWLRRDAMCHLRDAGERVFITIEPILRGDMRRLAQWCGVIEPEFVNIGADSKGAGLPEPMPEGVAVLLSGLRTFGVEIREKRNLGRLLPNGKDLT